MGLIISKNWAKLSNQCNFRFCYSRMPMWWRRMCFRFTTTWANSYWDRYWNGRRATRVRHRRELCKSLSTLRWRINTTYWSSDVAGTSGGSERVPSTNQCWVDEQHLLPSEDCRLRISQRHGKSSLRDMSAERGRSGGKGRYQVDRRLLKRHSSVGVIRVHRANDSEWREQTNVAVFEGTSNFDGKKDWGDVYNPERVANQITGPTCTMYGANEVESEQKVSRRTHTSPQNNRRDDRHHDKLWVGHRRRR